tara:strand:+ start:1777 stop:2859 length:1083 start_codon:yes stop_codon:yes gene_type:complete
MIFFENILDELSAKILVVDDNLDILFLNKSAEDYLCASLEEVKDKNIDLVFKEKISNELELQEVLEQKKSLKRHITTIFLKDNLQKKASFTASYFANEEFKGIIFEFFDNSKPNSIVDKMKKRTAASVTQAFSRGLAHEIKNPLSGIRGAAQLLSQKIEDPKKKEFANIILKESDRLANIVNKVSDNGFRLEQTYQNIHTILEKIPAFIKNIENQKIQIVKDYDPSLPLIEVDNSLISQVFFNLATNSVEAFKKKNTSGKIIIRSRVAYEVYINNKKFKTACQIDFIDNGPGIPDDIIDSIFFPLVSSKEIASGLGLSIVKGIINQHGGSIDCSSDETGTTFTILLPISEINFEKTQVKG